MISTHILARYEYLIYRANGKKRQGVLFDSMSRTWAQFKLALRNCRWEEAQIHADLLANTFRENDNWAIWKKVQHVKKNQTPLASAVGNVTGGEAITGVEGTLPKSSKFI